MKYKLEIDTRIGGEPVPAGTEVELDKDQVDRIKAVAVKRKAAQAAQQHEEK